MWPIFHLRLPRIAAVALLLLVVGACGDNPTEAPRPKTGQVVFWTDDPTLIPISVLIPRASVSGVVTRTSAASCGAAGGYTVTLPVGSHSYSAIAPGMNTASGSVDVTWNQCRAVQFYVDRPQTGQVMFWTDDSRLIPISVRLNNGQAAGAVTAAFPTATSCNQSGGYTVTLAPGTWTFSASSPSGYAGTGTVNVVAGACVVMKLYGAGPSPGQVIFWTDDASLPPIHVRVNNGQYTGTVTSPFASTPACGRAGGYTVTLPTGTATYSASNPNGYAGSGTVTVSAGGCTAVRFLRTSQTTGQVIFWTANPRYVPIAVRVNNGQSAGTVSSAFAQATACGQPGGYTVTLPIGTHTVAASNASFTWGGTATLQGGECLAFEFR